MYFLTLFYSSKMYYMFFNRIALGAAANNISKRFPLYQDTLHFVDAFIHLLIIASYSFLS